jgi:hypothetical protein
MRVMGTLVILLVVLLALCALAPVAGAIYIEGQTIPDDGMMHILAAESGLSGAAPAGEQANNGLPASISNALPAGIRDGNYVVETGLPGGFPSMITASTLPAMLPYEGLISMPVATIPSVVTKPTGRNVAGTTVLPSISGYMDFADPGSLQTNMPVLGSLFF